MKLGQSAKATGQRNEGGM